MTVHLDHTELVELLGILVDNATQHALSGVVIGGAHSDNRAIVRVSDDGPGVPEAMLESLLVRGVHLDERPDSTGGLAIALEICRAVTGSLPLRNLDQGFLVEVELHVLT